jgi:defect-in-organelle-trafficking protein DotC
MTGYVVGSPDDIMLQQIRDARAVPERLDAASRIGPVRHTALRETAQTLGVQAGLGVESRRIMAILDARADQLDRRFRFNELMMGVGVLPPVISQAEDAVALDGPTMRVAQRLYRLDEPARFVTAAPTWRDWLLVGLAPGLHPRVPQAQHLLPRDEQEQMFWQAVVQEAYAAGVAQAQSIFELNMARLERTYVGMRLFLDLYARGMVTKPQIVAAESIIERDDAHTVVIGSTVFRITRHSDFVEEFNRWKPLGR